ncbi:MULTISPECIES: RNA methyltransferase [Acinetobacter]|uniref:TrmH family RNA methyltransferase n=1 Tax=Acinetobacter TaxID=469 RepID=UPI0009945ACD|nr:MULTISPECIES: RNA methyltransferase [Acinetobacter]MCL6230533.1 RNA methyltransferase [Acinetobacter amyesii]MCL6234958.1 RNA methyltransferase [Acinetobacter amyesii]MCL6237319.1 RNA methyltransferase [Acinetobacter amyesii]MCL6240525.1 RNA methyltransferase [Acinetobacter amyesii]MCL6245084.1 RNA methyltransferase [Acinetobacter amyesii]
MALIYLESKDNPKIKHLRGLIEQNAYRKKQGQTVLEGTHLVLSWLDSKRPIKSIFTTEQAINHADFDRIAEQYQGAVFILSESLYKDISTLGTSIACLAIVDLPSSSEALNFSEDTLILDNIQDPGNVGTLLRSAAAAGIEQVVCTKGSASLWSPRVLRAGMGAHFSLNTFENIALEDILTKFKIPVYATSSHQSENLYSKNLRKQCVWILGNEGQGVSEYALQHAEAVAIPQPGGQESLNVAIAGSICFFEMVRQRQ